MRRARPVESCNPDVARKTRAVDNPSNSRGPAARLVRRTKHREQLDRTDAEVTQIGDLVDQPGIRAALGHRDAGAWMPGEAADMHLVDDRLGERPAQGCITLPVIAARVDHHAPQRQGHVVSRASSSLPAATRRPGYAFPVRVEQHFRRVEAQPSLGIKRSGNTIGIDLTRGDARHEDVPIMVCSVRPRVEIDHSRRLRSIRAVEQQQLRARAVLGEDAEIGTVGDERRAERETLAVFVSGIAEHGLGPDIGANQYHVLIRCDRHVESTLGGTTCTPRRKPDPSEPTVRRVRP